MAKENKNSAFGGEKDQHQMQDTEIKKTLSHIRHKILVMSGKGGVGKSSIAAYLSVVLARKGYKVGLMDVDLHGPSIPRMLGLEGGLTPAGPGGKAFPVKYLPNMEVISIETLMGDNKDAATIWRGPLKIGVIRQFVSDIQWMDLDYLVIDSPPGTGDEPLTVAQTIPDAQALIVTTPQEISLADVRKSINFCRQVHMEILGLVENMSGLTCPHCGKTIDIFKTAGGILTAKNENLRLLASLPFEPEVVQNGDIGNLGLLDKENSPFTQKFGQLADEITKLHEKKKGTHLRVEEKPVQIKKKEQSNGNILAIPVSEGKLSPHFGHCEAFAFFETENGEIKNKVMRTPPPHEPGVLPTWLHEQGADVVIVGGMGERAQQMLRQNGIDVIIGAPVDSPESLVNQYLADKLVTGDNICDH